MLYIRARSCVFGVVQTGCYHNGYTNALVFIITVGKFRAGISIFPRRRVLTGKGIGGAGLRSGENNGYVSAGATGMCSGGVKRR